MQTKEIPEAKPRSNTNLKASYMMVVNMDQFMGWLNVFLFVVAFLLCFLLKEYELFLSIILVFMLLCVLLYKSKLEPTLDFIKNSNDIAISLVEVIIRSIMNFTAHLGISWVALNNSLTIYQKLMNTGELDFLGICLMLIGIAPSCMILLWSILHNFQYRTYYHS